MTVENVASGLCYNDNCYILINAGGHLNNWAWPDVSGIKDFEG